MSRGLLCTQFTPGSRAAAVLCQHSNSGIRPVHLFAPTSLAFNLESHTCSFHDDGKVVKKDCYTNKYKERKKIKKKEVFSIETQRHWHWLTWEKDKLCGHHLGVGSTRIAVSGSLHFSTGPLDAHFHATVPRIRPTRQSNPIMLLFSLMVGCFWRRLKVFDHYKNGHCSFFFPYDYILSTFCYRRKKSRSFIFRKIREDRTFSLALSLCLSCIT